ncbi:hypothetical protein CC85DRAFT_288500 [Cutaneotrichosporon oleaginosum]|uniref:SAP domain-containing protein n=1 Tax=Cutaneotrichosporon oleaginosum TaxID=879819 RepID=A0A0J0XEN8_9TREE|nr:uncharacterized protein CC85DRAFT_288500 [Cutaneotrichosporon oleaginosum]KLT39513.1 hypothetical protein CC85DRAFT_288500 [Cutaneotrichosporon oleaginosum]TXT06824.1 hypothetical protein COLE_06155 [Cutaneotrichosporon oleaginosum]
MAQYAMNVADDPSYLGHDRHSPDDGATRPIGCPFCLFDSTKSFWERNFEFAQRGAQLRHIATHIAALSNDGSTHNCPFPACEGISLDREALACHLQNFHALRVASSLKRRLELDDKPDPPVTKRRVDHAPNTPPLPMPPPPTTKMPPPPTTTSSPTTSQQLDALEVQTVTPDIPLVAEPKLPPYSEMKGSQLKALCRSRNLSIRGANAVLAQRLREYDFTQTPGPRSGG